MAGYESCDKIKIELEPQALPILSVELELLYQNLVPNFLNKLPVAE